MQDDYQQQCKRQTLDGLLRQLAEWQQILTVNKDVFLAISEWQQSYLAIVDALQNKDVLNKSHAIDNSNGTIAQVIASINRLKLARLSCSH